MTAQTEARSRARPFIEATKAPLNNFLCNLLKNEGYPALQFTACTPITSGILLEMLARSASSADGVLIFCVVPARYRLELCEALSDEGKKVQGGGGRGAEKE